MKEINKKSIKISSLALAGVLLVSALQSSSPSYAQQFPGGFGDPQDPSPPSTGTNPLEAYNFGSGCTSMGPWTQSALDHSRAMVTILEKLQSNKKCTSIQESIKQNIANLKAFEESMGTTSFGMSQYSANEAMEQGKASLQVASLSGAGGQGFNAEDLAKSIADVNLKQASTRENLAMLESSGKSNRKGDAARLALNSFNSVLSSLPQYDECLMGSERDAANLIPTAINYLASLSSSTSGLGLSFASTVRNFMNYLRESQFTKTKRLLYQEQLRASIMCLLESTTLNYCTAKDALDILEYTKKQRLRESNSNRDPNDNSPLQGYRLLVRDIPNISKWLLEALFGVAPQFERDAEFRIETLAAFTELQNTIWSVQGLAGRRLQNMRVNTSLTTDEKKAIVLQLLREIVSTVGGGRGAEALNSNSRENFFLQTFTPVQIPFFLIGRGRNAPPEVVTSQANFQKRDWDDYMQAGGKNNSWVSEFDNPEALVTTIMSKFEEMSELAREKANVYVMNFLVLDMPLSTAKALISTQISVYQSLKNVYRYLDGLIRRLSTLTPQQRELVNPNIRANVAETRAKLKEMIDAFDQLSEYNTAEALDRIGTDTQFRKADLKKAYENVIRVGFENFNVLLQRDTYLGARLAQYVKADFALRIRTREDMTPLVQEILIASGRELESKLSAFFNHDPNGVKQDLNTAIPINRSNIQAIEGMFSDLLVPVVQEYKLRSQIKDRAITNADLTIASIKRLWGDSWRDVSRGGERKGGLISDDSIFFRIWSFFTWPYIRPISRYIRYKDRYPIQISSLFRNETPRGGADPYGTDQQVLARLCIQSLAFENRAKFAPLCNGITLESYFAEEGGTERLNASYNCYTSQDKVDLTKAGAACTKPNPQVYKKPTTPDNYCAFRDFNRRNLVYWLTKDVFGNN